MLSKKTSTLVRYLPSSAYDAYITFLDPNQGQASDGTPNPSIVVKAGVHANVQPWRGREVDKPQARIGQFSYKIIIRYPKTFSVNSGMLIQLSRAGSTHLYNIESISDPDGRGVELHIWVWSSNDQVVSK